MSSLDGEPRAFLARPPVVEAVCLLLGLAVLHPLLTPGYMWGHDTGAHMFRSVEVARALSEGVIYPRFLPDAYGGLGGPILTFNPPAPYYLPALLILAGLGPILTLKIAAGAYMVAGGLAMRVLARPHLGRIGSAVAGLAWVYLPYRIANLYVRMAFSELAVMILIPLAMAAARRAARRPGARRIAVAGLLMGSIPAAHFPGTVIGLPLAVVYALAFGRRGGFLRASGAVAACSALALAVSAFSWLPAVAEIGSTHYLDSTEGYDNYRHHFVEATQLVSPRWGFGSSMPGAEDTMSLQMGWAHLLALGAAVVAAVRSTRLRRFGLLCCGLSAAGVILMLGVSRPLWDILTVLQNVQFPWRFLLVAGVGSSLAAGMAAILPEILQEARLRKSGPGGRRGGGRGREGRPGRVASRAGGAGGRGRAVPMMVMALVVGACLPYLQSRQGEGTDEDFTPEAIRQRYFGELKFQPIQVATPRFRPRGPRAALMGPGEARITEEATHRMTVKTSAPAAATLRLHLFASPGWSAEIDGHVAPVRGEEGTGLVLVDVPAGASDVRLRYGITPARAAGRAIAGAGLLAAAALHVLGARGRRKRRR